MEQFRMLVDKRGVAVPFQEHRMGDNIFKETDVGLDSADTELLQGAIHDVGSILKGKPPGADFNQQRIVVRGYFGAGKSIAGIEADTAAGCRPVGCQGAEIGGKVVGRVFSGYPALDGVTAHVNGALGRNVDLRVGKLYALRQPGSGSGQGCGR